MQEVLGFVFFSLVFFVGPVLYVGALVGSAAFGIVVLFSDKRMRGAIILTVSMLWMFGPVALNQGRAVTLRAEIDALRVVPDDVSLRGSSVVFSIGSPDDPVCAGDCTWAMETGAVTAYGVRHEDIPTGRSWDLRRPDDLYRILPNPASVHYGDRYLVERIAEPDAVRIDYVFSGLLSRGVGGPGSAPTEINLSDGAPNLGSAVLNGWPGDGGEIVAHFARRLMRPSLHGKFLLAQDAYQYPSVAAQNLAERSLICGVPVAEGATSCPE